MLPNYTHLIVTRFNLQLWDGAKPLDVAWLAHRFELFEQYCYPSVVGQTEQNFKWFVSLIEKLEDAPHTILRCLPHSTIIERYGIVREINKPPMWLQVVHERNAAATGVRGLQRASAAQIMHFAIDDLPVTADSATVSLENMWRRMERVVINIVPQWVKARLRRTLWQRKHKTNNR